MRLTLNNMHFKKLMLFLIQYPLQNDNINRNQFTAIFFLDLKKAFDTVCPKTLPKKLDYYGLRAPVNKLLDSNLQRHQFVSLNNTYFVIQLNGYEVPQGSTLGPLLFLLYVNDLPNADQSVLRLFADDTCLLLSHSDHIISQEKLNQEVFLLCNWCNSKK